MRRDSRVHSDPVTRRDHARMASARQALDESVAVAAWESMLPLLHRALVNRSRGQAFDAAAFPSAGDARFRTAFETLMRQIGGRDDDHARTPMRSVLEARLARHAGLHASDGPHEWAAIAGMFGDCQSWAEFVSAIPQATIEASVRELTRPPADPADCVRSFGALREVSSALRSLDEARMRTRDAWRWLDIVDGYADEATLSNEMSLRSQLLARIAPTCWFAWATNLPHVVFTAVAINDIDDLDFLESVIEHCHEGAESLAVTEIILLLLVRRAIARWEQVDRSIDLAATRTSNVEEVDVREYEQWRDQWARTERPARVKRVAAAVLADRFGTGTPATVAKHLRRLPGADSSDALPAQTRLREELLSGLAKGDIDKALGELAAGAEPSGLLAAALLAGLAPDDRRCRCVRDAYRAWLGSPHFSWSSPLVGDDRDLAEALAIILAKSSVPSTEAGCLLRDVYRPSQGWGFHLEAWVDSVPRVAHVVIVASRAAAVVLDNGHAAEAAATMKLAWAELDALIVNAPTDVEDTRLRSAVAYVWAHAASLLEGADARLTAALGRLDDVRTLVSAARSFAQNAGTLPIDAQRAVRRVFEAQVPILERHPHITAEDFATLRTTVRELAAEAYVEAEAGSAS